MRTDPIVPRHRERLALALLLLLGLLTRVAFVTAFPTIPVSDFHNLVGFARVLREVSWTAPTWHWVYFNPGLPLILSWVLRLVPGPPGDVARLATAVVCGLIPLLPFVIWRGALSFRVRLLTGLALALWPGQVFFSGVVAQDNWVLPPTIALACLATRPLLGYGGRPVLAGLLYAAAGAVRQEMLLALLPLLPAAAGLGFRNGRRWRDAALCVLAAALPLVLLATQRGIATGRFALTTEHGGLAILGAYIPGATANAWADPLPYVATVEPGLLRDLPRLRREAGRLALREALRRPLFHAARIVTAITGGALEGEAANLYWSLRIEGGLPESVAPRAERCARAAAPLLTAELAVLHTLFLAALILAVAWRNPPLLALGAAILLKVGIHALTVSQGRYFLPVTALEILAVALAFGLRARRPPSRLPALALVLGSAAVLAASLVLPRAYAWVQRRDLTSQSTYRFHLDGPGSGDRLDCVVDRGLLTAVTARQAEIQTLSADPAPGETATAACELSSAGTAPLTLRLLDAYAPVFPGRMRQRVEVDGAVALDRDLAAVPGSGWLSIPLGTAGPGARREILIQVLAVQPEPGAAWGRVAATRFELGEAGMH